ncbi:MAG: glycosyltransferase [Sphingobacteriales bacterium]|nr:glycosyltransferase [Sphingobacteriales bacterium]
MLQLSVIISTYNPQIQRLNQTLNGLKNQTLCRNNWELILVDNNSTNRFEYKIDVSWHPFTKIIFEPRQGLTFARIKGFKAAEGRIIVLVDDDNILNNQYLKEALYLFDNKKRLGAAGGKSIPIFESEEPTWLKPFYSTLALRDLGEDIIFDNWTNSYPPSAPLGAGMILRKDALKSYIEKIDLGKSVIADRTGISLSSGGDNDIVIEILKSGWFTGYFPSLSLFHIIPEERTSVSYLSRLNSSSSRSWIQLLESHNINPWKKIAPYTVPLRKIKAWFTNKAWKNKVCYIKWQGACGTFEGLAL